MALTSATYLDNTVNIFDKFYQTKLVVNSSEYDLVYAYFRGTATSTNNTIPANFSALLFRIAQEGNYNVLDLLEIIKGQPNKLQMNSVICYYLNTFRSRAALYGIGIIPKPNEAVQRNVVM